MFTIICPCFSGEYILEYANQHGMVRVIVPSLLRSSHKSVNWSLCMFMNDSLFLLANPRTSAASATTREEASARAGSAASARTQAVV